LLASGAHETALVVGSETLSRVTDWSDRTTCVFFGDGAGAVVLQAGENEGGVLATTLGSDGSGWDLLHIPGGGSRRPPSTKTLAEQGHFIKMSGRPVFRFAVKTIPAVTREVLKKGDLDIAELSLLIPHQANQRIIEAAVRGLGIAPEMAYTNLERYGNTSGASIPIALCEAVEQDRIHPGDLVVLVGFGAGLTWGAAAVRWTQPQPVPLTRWQRFSRRLLYVVAMIRSRTRRARRWLGALFTESILNGKGDTGE
jgi:3-oxoacyl-[acyl-carrier-protein] synthase-3